MIPLSNKRSIVRMHPVVKFDKDALKNTVDYFIDYDITRPYYKRAKVGLLNKSFRNISEARVAIVKYLDLPIVIDVLKVNALNALIDIKRGKYKSHVV